ncbi:hypothetical protein MKX03_030512 [Papaver bracteatum]|nr:hypothetical protein MKX03_030512 [Papaver bracteatum]
MKRPPFNRFSESFSSIFPISFFTFSYLSFEIISAGGKTVWGNPADVGKIVAGEAFDVVLDNNDKDLDTIRHVVDLAKSAGAKQFLFISNAGIYKATVEPPHVEGDAVKADAGHVAVEKYIGETFGSWDSFGSGNNKDCKEWYFDRIVRNRSVPNPGSGMQLTNISHARDLSYMLIAAIENPTAACGNIFNCVSDRAVTLDGMAKLCAQSACLPIEIVHYDPKPIGVDTKKAFPFGNMVFPIFSSACHNLNSFCNLLLGWSSSIKLPEDQKERFEEYVKIWKDKKEIKFELR